jgi:glycosyltransferase involved in cell wall biosynthesis
MQFSNLEIAKGLHNLGHMVEVVTVRNKGAQSFVKQVAFPVTLMPKWPPLKCYSLSGWSRANWIFNPVYSRRIRERIARFFPNVIFVADEASNCFWGSWVAKIQVPYVSYCSVPFITVNEIKGKRGILSDIKFVANSVIQNQFKRFALNSYNSAKWISVVSQSTRKEILGAAPWLENRMDVIPRSIDDSFFENQIREESVLKLKHKLGIDQSAFVLLSVANLEPGKGVDDVLRALALLRERCDDPIRYIVVGDGSAAAALKKLSQTLELTNMVTFTGNIPHDELITFYDSCNLFALPSKRGKEESFGRIFIEAAARRRPVIGVNEGGMVDAIVDGRTGFLVKTGAVDEIRDRIAWCMANPDQTILMGNEAKGFAEANFRSAKVSHALAERLKWAAAINPNRKRLLSKPSIAVGETR